MDTKHGNGTSANRTLEFPLLQAKWNYNAVCTTIVAVVALLCNGGVILLYVKKQELRTPFGVLLLHLLCANFIYVLLTNPFRAVSALYPGWWIGNGWCSVFMYAFLTVGFITNLFHLSITAHRLWAVAYPISFRNRFKHSNAIALCAGLWIAAHAIMIPGLALDALYYRRTPLEIYGCVVNLVEPAMSSWGLFTYALGFAMTLFILAALPYVLWKEKVRSRAHMRSIALSSTSAADAQKTEKNKEGMVTCAFFNHSTITWPIGRIYWDRYANKADKKPNQS